MKKKLNKVSFKDLYSIDDNNISQDFNSFKTQSVASLNDKKDIRYETIYEDCLKFEILNSNTELNNKIYGQPGTRKSSSIHEIYEITNKKFSKASIFDNPIYYELKTRNSKTSSSSL